LDFLIYRTGQLIKKRQASVVALASGITIG
jgi:hypothetical protein